MTMVSADGWRVERVVRQVPGRGPSMRLRVSWRGYWQEDCETSEQVAKYVDISSLVPVVSSLYERARSATSAQKAAHSRGGGADRLAALELLSGAGDVARHAAEDDAVERRHRPPVGMPE